jgi:hypothetical protein
MPTKQPGVLSLSIQNIKDMETQIQSVQGLPANAVTIQQNVTKVVDGIIPELTSMQSQVQAVASILEDQINTELSQLQDINGGVLLKFLDKIKTEIDPINTLIANTLADCRKANDTIAKNDQALQQVGVDLSGKIAGLNSQLQGEKQKLDSLNKKKLYLLGLGIFGLPGLITLGVLLSEAQDQVNSTEKQMQGIHSQIVKQTGFLNKVGAFTQDFDQLIGKVSGVSNSLGFLSGDLDNILNDIDHGKITDRAQVQLYFTVALQEVHTLQIDVA